MNPRKFKVRKRTPYYRIGPQQGSPPDGYFDVGTNVVETAGQGGGATGYVHVKAVDGKAGEGWTSESDLQPS